MKKNKKNESGRSMLEMLGVLALLMLLTLGGFHVWGLLRSDVIAKDLTTAVMEEAVIRQHALQAKPSNAQDKISREGPHSIGLEVENGIDGPMSNYFWVKTDALTQEVCESMLKKSREIQSSEKKTSEIGLIAITDDTGKKITACQKDKTKNVLQYLFQKSPGYHLHGLYPWWRPQQSQEDPNEDGCPERTIPSGGSVSDGVLTCRAGYYKTGYGTCDETCKPCTGNTYRTEETTTENSSCDTCEAPLVVNSDHTSCDCLKVGEQCTNELGKGLYDASCTCVNGACDIDNDCEEGQKCCEGNQCCACDPDENCPTCPTNRPYAYNGQCVECITDGDCGSNEYCNEDSHMCELACNDGKSTYNKETQQCECNDGYHGAAYNRGASSTCFECGEGSYTKLPFWDEDKQTCVCDADSTCAGTEQCDDGECKPIETCNNFTATTCKTACRVENHTAVYTYAPVDRYWGNNPSTHKHCGDPNNDNERGTWVCDSGYVMRSDETCKNGCDGFVADTCTTKCTSSGTNAVYTPAAAGTACDTNKVCDGGNNQGVGSCVCDKGYEMVEGVCTAVFTGWYKNTIGNTGAKRCVDWRANTTTISTGSTSTSSCVCKKGYELKSGATACTAVAVGWYKDVVGNTGTKKCVDWRANTTTTSTGSTSTSNCLCQKGYELKSGATECTAVAKGWYKDVIANTGATKCPNGKTTDGTAKTAASACFCPSGKVILNGTCQNCPSCATCSGKDATSFTCNAECYKDGTACKACKGSGKTATTDTYANVWLCPNKCFRTFSSATDTSARFSGKVADSAGTVKKTWNGEICIQDKCTWSDFYCPGNTTTKLFKAKRTSSSGYLVIINKPSKSSIDRYKCSGTGNCTPM